MIREGENVIKQDLTLRPEKAFLINKEDLV
jgi:hypothetical protein